MPYMPKYLNIKKENKTMTDYPNNIPAKLEIIKASEITPKEVRWLWYPYIPFGKVTLLQGDPGDGKSKLMLSLAALLSKGAPLPFADEDESGEPMTVIYQTTEDDADDTVVPRFNSAGGDGDRLIFIKEDEKSLTFGDDRIREAVEKYHAKLLILDPMSSYIGDTCSMNNANEIRAEFNHLIAVAKDTGGLTYNEYFQRLIDEGKISTRGQKAGATIFNELVIDVNTRYFEEHGGYEYAKQFYEEAYRFGCEIYGEDNIVSAVMHADEINKAVSEELGEPVYHYHLHIVAIPTVRKEILWSKRCKDEALRGTVKEVINQVSHSKKWKNTVPLLDENGQQVISKYGKPMFRKSYSVLQDMTAASSAPVMWYPIHNSRVKIVKQSIIIAKIPSP